MTETRNRLLLVGSVLLLCCLPLHGQTQAVNFDQATTFYKQGQYLSAYTLFIHPQLDRQGASEALLASYKLLCEIALEDPGATERTRIWAAQWPSAPLREQVYLNLGLMLVRQEQFDQAYQAFEKIAEKRLPRTLRASYHFEMGYAALQLELYDAAMTHFKATLKASPDMAHRQGATYYIGYIHYTHGQFEEALPYLDPLREWPTYSQLASVYALQARFYLKDYQRVIADGNPLYETADPSLKITLSKILSESFFALGKNDQARIFFDSYISQAQQLSRTDRYFSGILYYTLGDYALAAEQLQEVSLTTDSLGQNALYHLAESYIELKNKVGALEAFRQASQLFFDPAIREDAFFNYAKLSFDLNGDITAISDYRATYPNSPKLDEIQTYIAANNFLKQDYAAAVTALQAIQTPTADNIEALKRAAYLRGIQLYDSGSYRDAEAFFTLSGHDYWIAECQYRSNALTKAIGLWEQFIKTRSGIDTQQYNTAYFNVAYAYFKLADYPMALQWFNRYINLRGARQDYIADSYLRMGDANFAGHEHAEAETQYQNALNHHTVHPDYALYQIAMAQGVLDREEEKIQTLNTLMLEYPRSEYYSAALYERGRTYVQTTQYARAEQTFQTILASDLHSAYHAKALVELGLIQINSNNPDAALDYYKEVMRRFPESSDATNALAGIENIYVNKNDSQGYFDYVATLGIETGKTADEKELMVFASAEQLYLNQQNTAAITALHNFIAAYPESEKMPAAYFYLGECLSQTSKMQEAADAYLVVMQQPSGSFTELATRSYAQIQYNFENYALAADAYHSLLEIAVIENNKTEALRGLQWSFFKNKQYRNAITQSEKVLENTSFSEEDRRDAQYIQAKSYLALGQREQAIPLLQSLSKEADLPSGAEAFFLLCKDAFDTGQFDAAEALIYQFSDTETPQEYWIARAFLLLGDIYAEKGEWAQARATFESVRDGYSPEKPDDIAQLVAVRIKQCEDHEKEHEE